MKNAPVCPVCGSTDLSTASEVLTTESRSGSSLSYPVEVTKCADCGEEFHTRQQYRAANESRATAAREAEGLLTPQEIRSIRDGVGRTQEQLERLLGLGRKSFARWEAGTVNQSRAADLLLKALAVYPALLDIWRDWPSYRSVTHFSVSSANPTYHDQGSHWESIGLRPERIEGTLRETGESEQQIESLWRSYSPSIGGYVLGVRITHAHPSTPPGINAETRRGNKPKVPTAQKLVLA